MATIHQRHILTALADGAVIRVENINYPSSSARRVYRLSSTQQILREETVKRLLDYRLIKPEADGLFGNDGPVQTYTLFRASEGGA